MLFLIIFCSHKHNRCNRDSTNNFVIELLNEINNSRIFYCLPNIHSPGRSKLSYSSMSNSLNSFCGITSKPSSLLIGSFVAPKNNYFLSPKTNTSIATLISKLQKESYNNTAVFFIRFHPPHIFTHCLLKFTLPSHTYYIKITLRFPPESDPTLSLFNHPNNLTFKSFYIVTSICTVLLLIPKCFAA